MTASDPYAAPKSLVADSIDEAGPGEYVANGLSVPAGAGVDDAVAPGAPLVWPAATGNLACVARHGGADGVARPMAQRRDARQRRDEGALERR